LRFYFLDFLFFKLICYYLCLVLIFYNEHNGFHIIWDQTPIILYTKLIYGFTQLTQRLMWKIISTLKHDLTCHMRGHSSNTWRLRGDKRKCHMNIFEDRNSDFTAFGSKKNNVWEFNSEIGFEVQFLSNLFSLKP
jgi:hypothetical protein